MATSRFVPQVYVFSLVAISACLALPASAWAQGDAPDAGQSAPPGRPRRRPARLHQARRRQPNRSGRNRSLREEFESVRDTYGARLAALEAKARRPRRLARRDPGGRGSGACRSAGCCPGSRSAAAAEPTPEQVAAAAPQGAPPNEVAVPQGAAGGGGPEGALPVYGNAVGIVEDLQPRHGGDRQLPRRRRGEHDRIHRRRCEMHEAEASLPGGRRSRTRAPTSSSSFSPGGRRGRGRLPHVPDAARRPAGEGRQDEARRSARSTRCTPTSLPWADRPLVDHATWSAARKGSPTPASRCRS